MTTLIQLTILAAVVTGISIWPNALTFTALFMSPVAIASLDRA